LGVPLSRERDALVAHSTGFSLLTQETLGEERIPVGQHSFLSLERRKMMMMPKSLSLSSRGGRREQRELFL